MSKEKSDKEGFWNETKKIYYEAQEYCHLHHKHRKQNRRFECILKEYWKRINDTKLNKE